MTKVPPLPSYRFTKAALSMHFSEWKKIGGCGISDWASALLCTNLKCAPKNFDSMTLAVISAGSLAAEREMARFAFTHLDRKDLAEEGKNWENQ